MNDRSDHNEETAGAVTDFGIGEGSSILGTFVFFLLCFVPALAAVLFGGVDETTWIVITLLLVLMIVLWAMQAWKAKAVLISSYTLPVPILGLAVIGCLQLLPIAAARSLDPYSTRLFTVRLVVFFLFLVIALTIINNERRLKTAAYFVVMFGAGMAFFGILQSLAEPDGIYGLRETVQARPFGPFVNGHHFAAFMEMTGGVTLGLVFEHTKRRERKVLLAAGLIVMGVAVVLTGSRGGMLGFVSVLAMVTVLNLIARRRRSEGTNGEGFGGRLALAAGAAALLFVIFGLALFLGGNEELLRGVGAVNANADVSSGRFHFWPIALQIFLERPFIGAGLDAFGVAFTRYDTWSGYFRVEQAHNEYLQILADAGIAGFLCVVGFIYLLGKSGLRSITMTHGFRKSAAIGALGGCFGIMIHSFFDFPLRTYSNAFFFLLLAAIASVSIASADGKRHRAG